MIRYALAFLGLSAGAGAAQELVPVASVLEICGLHAEVQAEDTNTIEPSETEAPVPEEVAGDDSSTPQVPPVEISDVTVVAVRAVVQRPVLPAESNGAKPPTDFIQTNANIVPACVVNGLNIGLHPIETDAAYSVAMDGSDPSAMFCP